MAFLKRLKPLLELIPEVSMAERMVSIVIDNIKCSSVSIFQLSLSLHPIICLLLSVYCYQQPSFSDRMGTTLLCMVIFLSMYNFPIFGIPYGTMVANPFYHQRVMLAASSGTLMELGE